MRRTAAILCLTGLLAVANTGCIAHDGQASLFLTSSTATVTGGTAASSAQQVNLEITNVAVWDPEQKGYVSLSFGSHVYELVGLVGRGSLLAYADQLSEGTYTQVRLTLSESNSSVVNVSGRRNPLTVEPTIIDVPVRLDIVEDTESRLYIDLDLDASLALKSNGTWVLRPVVRQVSAPRVQF